MSMGWRERWGCRRFEARLEDRLESLRWELPVPVDHELSAHLEVCEKCRMALEDARAACALLQAGSEPLPESMTSDPYFASRVAARVRAAESDHAGNTDFWPALEFLSLRLTAGALSLALILGAWAAWAGRGSSAQLAGRGRTRPAVEAVRGRAGEARVLFPETSRQPASGDEVVLTLVSSDEPGGKK